MGTPKYRHLTEEDFRTAIISRKLYTKRKWNDFASGRDFPLYNNLLTWFEVDGLAGVYKKLKIVKPQKRNREYYITLYAHLKLKNNQHMTLKDFSKQAGISPKEVYKVFDKYKTLQEY